MSKPQSKPGLLISRDLFFTSKVTGTAQQLGLVVDVVPDCAAAIPRVTDGTVGCVFVDLGHPVAGLAELIAAAPVAKRPAVLAFGSHVATAVLEAAKEAGCDEVLPRSRFSAELPDLLKRYLTAE